VIYAKRVQTTDPRFRDRDMIISSGNEASVIPVPDTVVVCNGCNKNVYPGAGYLIYLSKQDLMDDLPYDFYCDDCRKKLFPGSKEARC